MSAPSSSWYLDRTGVGYPCDVDDATWALIAPILAQARGRGRPRAHADRLIYNAILYVVRGGIQWRLLPPPFPPWPTVYSRFRRWADAGMWETLTTTLRAELRIEWGREPEPSAGIIDSQSVATGPGSGVVGYDAAKNVKGRKRHLVVDTQGTVLAALVTPANVQDPRAAAELLAHAKARSGRLTLIWGDGRYGGPIVRTAARALDLTIEVVAPPKGQKNFQALPRRWVIETTQSHHPSNALFDNRAAVTDHRAHRAAESGGAQHKETDSRGFAPRGRWSAMFEHSIVTVPPRPMRACCSVGGNRFHRPIAAACWGC